MFCPNCGTRCDDNAIACSNCGAILPGLTSTLGGIDAPASGAGRAKLGGRTLLAKKERVSASDSTLDPSERDAAASTPRVGQTRLVVEQGRILGEQFLLADRDVIIGRYDASSGRCPDIDLTAQDPAYVHRQHVRLSFEDGGAGLTVHDLGGRNGSYLNNKLLDKHTAAVVRLGDKLRVGRVVLRVQPLHDEHERSR